MVNRNKQEWGCLHWFLLGFMILAVLIVLLVMIATPSGGGSPCESMTSEDDLTPTDYWSKSTQSGILPVSYGKVLVKPGPGSGAKAPAPAKPNLTKPIPAKPVPVKP